jgi:hypothetical protein
MGKSTWNTILLVIIAASLLYIGYELTMIRDLLG